MNDIELVDVVVLYFFFILSEKDDGNVGVGVYVLSDLITATTLASQQDSAHHVKHCCCWEQKCEWDSLAEELV